MYSTRTGPGHGRVLFVRCCAAAYCLPGRGVWSEFMLELVRYIFRVCTCGTVFGLDRPSSVSCTCMCVCTAVGMCSPSVVRLVVSTCMRACTVYGMDSLGGVRSIHECLCLYVRTVIVPLVQCFGIGSLGDASILRRPACLGLHAVRVLAWTAWAAYVVYMIACACTYALCSCNVWHGQPERCTDCAYTRVLGVTRCTCTCTVYDMDNLGGVRSVHEWLWLYVHTVLVQCI